MNTMATSDASRTRHQMTFINVYSAHVACTYEELATSDALSRVQTGISELLGKDPHSLRLLVSEPNLKFVKWLHDGGSYTGIMYITTSFEPLTRGLDTIFLFQYVNISSSRNNKLA